ncbi:hypothetical protein [Paraeggerthella sp.]|uniref:hypothetical protein n=1 Tax=Paraeggerthella sp. TaxID=2897350 RepID=UPI0035277E06
MDFKLTDEQELIVDSYREYMESENWETYFHECDEAHEYPASLGEGPVRAGLRPDHASREPWRSGP